MPFHVKRQKMVFCNQVEHGYVKLACCPFSCPLSVSFSLRSPSSLSTLRSAWQTATGTGIRRTFLHRFNSHAQTGTNTSVSTSKAVERAVSSFSFYLSVSLPSLPCSLSRSRILAPSWDRRRQR